METKKFIIGFMDFYDYPAEAKDTFINAFDTIENSEFKQAFYELADKYLREVKIEKSAFISETIKDIATQSGIHKYTLKFLLLLICAEQLLASYRASNIPDEIYRNTMYDLKVKLNECKTVKNVWGTFTSGWYCGIFSMRTFGLGRLEFEMSEFPFDNGYHHGGIHINRGDFVVFAHIPSGSPLTHESAYDSYRIAYNFFSDKLNNKPLVICCHSWLLYPDTKDLFKCSRNITDFYNDFDIIGKDESEGFSNAWRVFEKDYNQSEIDSLPDNTSLQRNFIQWLKNGGKTGNGFGVIIFDGQKIINK